MNDFFGIIDHYVFTKLSREEKYKFLIEKNIFTKTDTLLDYDDEQEVYHYGQNNDSRIFTLVYSTPSGDYFINDIILELMKAKVIEQCENTFNSIMKKEDVLIDQYSLYPKEKLIEARNSLKLNTANRMSGRLYRELTYFDFDDFESQKTKIANYVKFDNEFIYNYLTGIKKTSTYFESNYSNYITNSLIIRIIDDIYFDTNSSDLEDSIPRKIALLESLGFFKLESIRTRTDADKYKFIAFLFNISRDNENGMDSIRRNYKCLDPKSGDNGQKYTAHKHVATIINDVLAKQL